MLLTKTDAARLQLETAIRIYFADGDPVSVHTLVAAASGLIGDVGTASGKPNLVAKDWMLEFVKPEMHSEFRTLLAHSQNWFKHADRDPATTLDFNPGEARSLLLAASLSYKSLTGHCPPLMQLFLIRASLTWASEFLGYQRTESMPQAVRLEWAELPNPDFIKELLPQLENADALLRSDQAES